jgi:hypothetical protein
MAFHFHLLHCINDKNRLKLNKNMKKLFLAIAIFSIVLSPLGAMKPAEAQLSTIRTIIFPVIGKVTYYDDFGVPRSGGRLHEGQDLMGKKMLPLVAAVDGTIINVNYPEESWGYSVTIKDSDGYTYHYIHMNNDTPGTDDGQGDGMNAYAPDVKEGNKVAKGQLIGYMGDSGNAETTTAHLHFEIRYQGTPFSPYQSLQNATKIAAPVTDYPKQSNEILPYGNFGGGANVAAGNLDKDTGIEYVTGAGPGGGPLIKVLEKDGKVNKEFFAYDPNFTAGIDVAVGDIDGNGVAEIITAPGPGGGPHVKVFKADGTLLKEFMAYGTSFSGGVRVSASDIDSNKKWEIVTAPATKGGPHVKVWNADTLTVVKELMAYDVGFQGGLDVGGYTGGFVTVPNRGGGPHVKVFDKNAQLKSEFFAYAGTFTVGLRVSVADGKIVTAPASTGGPHVKMFSLTGSESFSKLAAFEPWWRGGYDIAAYKGGSIMSSMGGRRTSVRQVVTSTTTR